MASLCRLLAPTIALLAAAACSSSDAPLQAPSPGACESAGYEPPVDGACLKGTCRASGAYASCCGSLCASCEAKGLVSFTSSGVCPAGLCPSYDVTAALSCCDTCAPLGGGDAGGVEASAPGDAASDAPPEGGGKVRDGSGGG